MDVALRDQQSRFPPTAVKAAVCRTFGAPLEIEDLAPRPAARRRGARSSRRVRDLPQRHLTSSTAPGAAACLPSTATRRQASSRRWDRASTECTPGDRVVVSLLRSCGRCFFCERGEAYLCEHEFPADRAEQAPRPPRASHCPAACTRQHSPRPVVVDQSQVAVVPDVAAFDVAALLGCGVVTAFGAVVTRPRCPRARACSSSERAESGSTACRVLSSPGRRRSSPSTSRRPSARPRSRSARPMPSIRRHAIPSDGGARAHGRPRRRLRVRHGGVEADAVEQGLGLRSSRRDARRRRACRPRARVPCRGGRLRLQRRAHPRQQHGLCPAGESPCPHLVDLYGQGSLKLDELITARYPLERINEAMRPLVATAAGAAQRDRLRPG